MLQLYPVRIILLGSAAERIANDPWHNLFYLSLRLKIGDAMDIIDMRTTNKRYYGQSY